MVFASMAVFTNVMVLSDDHVGPSGYKPLWPLLLVINGGLVGFGLLLCPGLHWVARFEKEGSEAT